MGEPIEDPIPPIAVAPSENPLPPPADAPAGASPAEIVEPTAPFASPEAVEEAAAIGSEVVASALAPTLLRSASPEPLAAIGSATFSALAEARNALASSLEALSDEVAGLTRREIGAVADSAIEMLQVRTVYDAIAVNAGFTGASLDHWLGSSARFSELGTRLAVETTRPFLERLGRNWLGAVHPGR
ncbi:MAG: phasin family protein [Stellaceae bacterium]